MELVDIFPATIAVAELKSLSSTVMVAARQLLEVDCTANAVAGDGRYTRDQQLLNHPLFAETKRELLELCRQFAKAHSHQIEDVALSNSWGNIVNTGENIRYHRHSNAYICGSFYLSEGSPFNILNSHHGSLFNFEPTRTPGNNYRAMESFSIPPKPGRVILFPANLMHCVLPSRSSAPRYSIAFNVIPVGKLGGPTSLLHIQVPGE